MNGKRNAERDAQVNKIARPSMYAFGAAAVICVLALFTNVTSPDLFAALGGWFTVIGLLFVISVWAGLSMVRRMNERNTLPDESSETPR